MKKGLNRFFSCFTAAAGLFTAAVLPAEAASQQIVKHSFALNGKTTTTTLMVDDQTMDE